MTSGSNGEAGQWPSWPPAMAGTVLLDVVVDLPVDELFKIMYGGDTDFRRHCNEAMSNRDYSCTPWVTGMEELAGAGSDAGAPLADPATLRAGCVKKAQYASSSMGVKYRNEELMRLVEAAPGSRYTLEFCVATTATYGDKFRPVLRQEMQSLEGGGRTALRTAATLVFLKSVNGLIKGMMEKGARDGMKGNFGHLRKVLESCAKVSDAAAAGVAAPAAPKPAAPPEVAPAAEGGAPPPVPPVSLLEAVAGAPLVGHLKPWAAYLHALLASVPVVGGLDQEGVLVGLAALILLAALRIVVDVLQFIQHASEDPQDTVALLTHYLFKVLDVPDNIQEVLSACVLIFLVRVLVNRLSVMLPGPPPLPAAAQPPAEPAAAAAAAPGPAAAAIAAAAGAKAGAAAACVGEAAAADAAAGAAAGALAAGAADPLSPTRSDLDEAQGVVYEGYAQVMASVDKQVREDESNLTSPPPEPSSWSAGGMQRFNEQFHVQSMKAVRQLKGNFKEFGRSMKALTGSSASAKSAPNLTRPSQFSPEKAVPEHPLGAQCSGLSGSEPTLAVEGSEDGGDLTPPSPGSITPTGTLSPDRALSPAKSRGELSPSRLSPGPPAELAAAAAAGAAAGAAAAGAAAASASAQPEPASSLGTSPTAGASPSPSRRASAAAEAGIAPQASGGSFFSRSLLRRGGSGTGEKTPAASWRSGREGATPLSPRSASELAAILGTGRLQRTPKALLPAAVPAEMAGHAITAELFENQRLQPFRGWGSTWPGHFLPTDKVHRWSLREIPGEPVVAGQAFDDIAPQAPEGWLWVEGEWRVDTSGREVDAVDEDGWAYGLDFAFVREYPFLPGQGKKKVTDFVRRRRWIRTQIPATNLVATQWATASSSSEAEAAVAAPAAPTATAGAGAAVPGSTAGAAWAEEQQGKQGGEEGEPLAGSHARRALEDALAPTQQKEAAQAASAAVDSSKVGAAPPKPPSSTGTPAPASPLKAPAGPLAAAVAAQQGFDAGHLSLGGSTRPRAASSASAAAARRSPSPPASVAASSPPLQSREGEGPLAQAAKPLVGLPVVPVEAGPAAASAPAARAAPAGSPEEAAPGTVVTSQGQAANAATAQPALELEPSLGLDALPPGPTAAEPVKGSGTSSDAEQKKATAVPGAAAAANAESAPAAKPASGGPVPSAPAQLAEPGVSGSKGSEAQPAGVGAGATAADGWEGEDLRLDDLAHGGAA